MENEKIICDLDEGTCIIENSNGTRNVKAQFNGKGVYTKEKAVLSAGWLYGGNYGREQETENTEIINKFEDLDYLERENVLDIMGYIFKKGIDNGEIIDDLYGEYKKQT